MTVKKFENLSIFDEVIMRTKRVPNFCGHPVYAALTFSISLFEVKHQRRKAMFHIFNITPPRCMDVAYI